MNNKSHHALGGAPSAFRHLHLAQVQVGAQTKRRLHVTLALRLQASQPSLSLPLSAE